MLEIGCGAAGLAGSFNKLGVAYYGIDIDQRMTNKAVSNGIVNIRNIDFFDIDENERYDVICASQVLEHITEPDEFIAKIFHQLNEDGIVHIDVPNHKSFAGLIEKIIRRDKNRYGGITWPHHLISYQSHTLDLLLRKYFSDVQVFLANSNDRIWGQVASHSIIQKIYFFMSAIFRRHSLLVVLCRKRQNKRK